MVRYRTQPSGGSGASFALPARFAVALVAVAVLLASVATEAVAAPPANDDVENAATSSVPGPGTVTATNVEATKQTGEPNHAGNVGGASVWWRGTSPADATVTIDTCGSGFDTLLAVYRQVGSGPVPPFTNLMLWAYNDDAALGPCSGSLQSSVTFPVTAGVTYYIAVDGYNDGTGADQGSITLTLSLGSPPPPPPPPPPPSGGGAWSGFLQPSATMPSVNLKKAAKKCKKKKTAKARRKCKKPKSGSYAGATAQGFPISLEVQGRSLSSVQYTINASGPGVTCQSTGTVRGPATIAKGGDFSLGFRPTSVSGKFVGSQVAGSIFYNDTSPPPCSSGEVAFAARRG